MLRRILLTFILSLTTLIVIGKNETKSLWGSSVNYEVETFTTATRGTKLIKVWAFDSKVEDAIIQAMKNAISAVIFKGLPAGGSANVTPPLLSDPSGEQTYATYFDTFFATGGDYLKFVVATSDQAPSGRDRLKLSKGYKVGVVVQIQYENLRNQLIKDGIIHGLDVLGDAKNPTIMVVPSDIWCVRNNYILGVDENGRKIPDYQKAWQNNSEMRALVSAMGGIMAGRKYPMKSLEAELKKIDRDNATLNAMAMDQGDMRFIKENNVDKLLRSANADIIVDIDFEIKSGMANHVIFNVQALDAYTSKIITGNTGGSTKSYTASLDQLFKESVESYIDQFTSDVTSHFEGLIKDGREVRVAMMRWDDSYVDFETFFDYNGQEAELADIIEVWMAEKTVASRYSVEQRTANMLRFEQVRIPLYSTNIAGREVAIDAAAWLRPLSVELRKEQYGSIPTQILTKGLGEVWLIIGEKK